MNANLSFLSDSGASGNSVLTNLPPPSALPTFVTSALQTPASVPTGPSITQQQQPPLIPPSGPQIQQQPSNVATLSATPPQVSSIANAPAVSRPSSVPSPMMLASATPPMPSIVSKPPVTSQPQAPSR